MSVKSGWDMWYGEKNMTNTVTCNYATKDDLRGAVIDLKSFIQLTSNYYDKSNKVNEKKETKTMKFNMPKIKNIDFQPPLTIVVWEDGTKTFVKCAKDEIFDPEKGAAMAIAKKALGDKYAYIETISYYVNKWLKKDKNRNYVKVDRVLKENKEDREEKFTEKENKIINYLRDCEEDREEVTDYILNLVKEIYWNK